MLWWDPRWPIVAATNFGVFPRLPSGKRPRPGHRAGSSAYHPAAPTAASEFFAVTQNCRILVLLAAQTMLITTLIDCKRRVRVSTRANVLVVKRSPMPTKNASASPRFYRYDSSRRWAAGVEHHFFRMAALPGAMRASVFVCNSPPMANVQWSPMKTSAQDASPPPDFFGLARAFPILAGRDFNDWTAKRTTPSVIVSETLAQRISQSGSPSIGHGLLTILAAIAARY